MSPEQCEGKGLIDHRSDVYSLGVVMYELLTGRVPFPGEGFGEVLVAHLTKQPDPPSQHNPDIKPEIEALVMHAIEKDRNRRFQSMDEFAAAVANPAAHLQAYSPLPGYTPAQPSAASRSNPGGTMMLPDGTPPYPPLAGGGPTTGTAPRPTTLSGAAAELDGDRPRKSKAPIVLAAAATLLIAGGGFLVLHGKTEEKPAMVPAVVQQAPKDESVKLRVTSDPPGARVFRADTGSYADGTTPLTIVVKRGAPNFDIQIKLDGYKAKTKSLSTDHSDAVLVSLEKEPAPVAALPPPTAPVVADVKPEHHHHHDHKSAAAAPATNTTAPVKKGKDEGGDDMKLLQPKF
jgi:serine/threonine-protein kinase